MIDCTPTDYCKYETYLASMDILLYNDWIDDKWKFSGQTETTHWRPIVKPTIL